MKRKRFRGRSLATLSIALLAGALAVLAISGSAIARPSYALYDQTSGTEVAALVSRGGGIEGADDFVVPTGKTWRITSVYAPGYDNLDLTSVTVTIYSDSSGPGTQVYTVTVPEGSYTDEDNPNQAYQAAC